MLRVNSTHMSLPSVLNTSWGFSLTVVAGVVVGIGLIGAVADFVFPRGKVNLHNSITHVVEPSVHEVASVLEMKQLIAENPRVIVHCGSMQYGKKEDNQLTHRKNLAT